MSTFIWTCFAVLALMMIFASCVIIVTAGTRMAENAVAKHRMKSGS